jgi:hypothetical protein
MHRKRFTVNPICSSLGLALLIWAAPFSFGSEKRAAPSLSTLSRDLSSVGQPGVQAPLAPGPYAEQPELDHRLFLPVIANGDPEIDLEIYDWSGTLQSWDWLVEHYGAVWLNRGSGAASVRVLREEASGQTVLIVSVERDGQPVQNAPVMFYWPDAPWLPPELKACGLDRALVVYTNTAGEAHFAMGGGSAYLPPDGGPHIVWVGGPGSDCLGGMGWLAFTNHFHVNSEWELP